MCSPVNAMGCSEGGALRSTTLQGGTPCCPLRAVLSVSDLPANHRRTSFEMCPGDPEPRRTPVFSCTSNFLKRAAPTPVFVCCFWPGPRLHNTLPRGSRQVPGHSGRGSHKPSAHSANLRQSASCFWLPRDAQGAVLVCFLLGTPLDKGPGVTEPGANFSSKL